MTFIQQHRFRWPNPEGDGQRCPLSRERWLHSANSFHATGLEWWASLGGCTSESATACAIGSIASCERSPASSPPAIARLVLCRHRVPLEDAALSRADYDRPTRAKPRPRLSGDGFTRDQLPSIVRLMHRRIAGLLTSLQR